MPKTFDAREFLAWVREQPPEKRFSVDDSGECALANFGFPHVFRSTCESQGISQRLYDTTVEFEPPTFGALAARLEALPECQS